MSSDHGEKRPIIIKKKHAAHDDDHGGHWKIAYADFVTAMMAFFLVMWLVNIVSDKQRRGLAQYFSASSIQDLRNGNGMMDGNRSALQGATSEMSPISLSQADDTAKDDDVSDPSHDSPTDTDAQGGRAKSGEDRAESQSLDAARAELDRMTSQGELKAMAQNISVEVTPEGLRVQIFDRDGEPMFAPGSVEPTHRLTTILDALMPVLGGVRNGFIVTGHTDDQKLDRPGYSNWELSSDRANATRRYLRARGIDDARMFKVEGRASADPLLPQAPGDPRNRRIALTLLRAGAAAQMRTAMPAGKAGKPV